MVFRDGADSRRELHVVIGFRAGPHFRCLEPGHVESVYLVHDVGAGVARQIDEHDTCVWRFIRYYMDEARRYEGSTVVEIIGIREHSPNAAKVIDKFHVVKHANEAVNKVRKAEAGRSALPKRAIFLWLRNESKPDRPAIGDQTEPAKTTPEGCVPAGCARLSRASTTPAKAELRATQSSRPSAPWMMRSRLDPMKVFAC